MLAGKERCVDCEAGSWWDRFKMLAGKVHWKCVEYALFGIPTSVWTAVQLEKTLREGQRPLFYSIKFNFC